MESKQWQHNCRGTAINELQPLGPPLIVWSAARAHAHASRGEEGRGACTKQELGNPSFDNDPGL